MAMPDFNNQRVKDLMSEANLTEDDVRKVYPAWNEIAKLLGPEGCHKLGHWIETRTRAIKRIKEQPFYSRRTE